MKIFLTPSYGLSCMADWALLLYAWSWVGLSGPGIVEYVFAFSSKLLLLWTFFVHHGIELSFVTLVNHCWCLFLFLIIVNLLLFHLPSEFSWCEHIMHAPATFLKEYNVHIFTHYCVRLSDDCMKVYETCSCGWSFFNGIFI